MTERDFSEEKKISDEYNEKIKKYQSKEEKIKRIEHLLGIKNVEDTILEGDRYLRRLSRTSNAFLKKAEKLSDEFRNVFLSDKEKFEDMKKEIEQKHLQLFYSQIEELIVFFNSGKEMYDYREIAVQLSLSKKSLRIKMGLENNAL